MLTIIRISVSVSRVFFDLSPRMQSFVAICLFAFAGMLTLNSINKAEEYEIAMSSGPPEAVELDVFDRGAHLSGLDEVHIVAQMHVQNVYEYTIRKRRSAEEKILIPLFEVSNEPPRPLGVLETDSSGRAAMLLKEMIIGQGEIGPIVRINGTTTYAGGYKSDIEKAFGEFYGFYSPDTLFVSPFFGDRSQRLEPVSSEVDFAAIFGILGLFVAGSAAFSFFQQRANKRKAAPAAGSKKAGSPDNETVVRRKK